MLSLVNTAPSAKGNISGTRDIADILGTHRIRNQRRFCWLMLVNISVLPGRDLAISINGGPETTAYRRTIVILTNIFFSRPDELYRALHFLRKQSSLNRIIWVRLTSEATPHKIVVHSHVPRLHAESFGYCVTKSQRILTTDPDFALTILHMGRGI